MRRNPFFRRMGCFFVTFAFFSLVGVITLVSLIAGELGLIQPFPIKFAPLLPAVLIVIVFVFAALFWGARTLRRLSMPLDDLLEAADRLAQGDYSVHLQEKGLPETRRLIQTFNSMAARLQSTDQQRRQMLADITHELRTPLTVIQGNLEGMLDGMYPADAARLKTLLEETRLLARLVNDLKTLALAESGALRLEREPTDLQMLIQDTLKSMQEEAASARVRIDASLETTPLVDLDPGRIREVLTNLLSNSIRYTPAGGTINISLSIRNSDSQRSIRVIVEDQGPGISAEDLPHIFERFYKSVDSTGMGLGLAIARLLVEAHSGRITAESQPGSGTRIAFTLPV